MCQRMVDKNSLGKNTPVRAIINYGLEFFFKPVERYILSFSCDFYTRLIVVDFEDHNPREDD